MCKWCALVLLGQVMYLLVAELLSTAFSVCLPCPEVSLSLLLKTESHGLVRCHNCKDMLHETKVFAAKSDNLEFEL